MPHSDCSRFKMAGEPIHRSEPVKPYKRVTAVGANLIKAVPGCSTPSGHWPMCRLCNTDERTRSICHHARFGRKVATLKVSTLPLGESANQWPSFLYSILFLSPLRNR